MRSVALGSMAMALVFAWAGCLFVDPRRTPNLDACVSDCADPGAADGASDDDGDRPDVAPADAEPDAAASSDAPDAAEASAAACAGERAATAETCNGRDDDCDDQVDNGFDVGTPCTVGKGSCARTGIHVCTDDHTTTRCSAQEGQPTAETCNGIDDDCDDAVDEEIVGVGAPCFVGLGACRREGVTACVASQGRVACNAAVVAGMDEMCDSALVDENCDGKVNEGCGCDVGRSPDLSCGTDEGACKSGVQACVGGHYSQDCQGEVKGTKETCNGIDDDCNGLVDDGFDLGSPCVVGMGRCQRQGLTVCAASHQSTTCSATAGDAATEICNGEDDDCNGTVDDVADLGAACATGVGGCRREGVTVCQPGRGGVVCNAVAGAPATEVCDAAFLDENCDGRSNETCTCVPGVSPDLPCGTDKGACRLGKQVCANGVYGTCEGGIAPDRDDPCDGKDNDCNGTIDDGFDVGGSCSVGRGACQRFGVKICAADGKSTACSASAGATVPETCNGVDDDCNGVIDDLAELGAPCGAGVGGCRRAGVLVCLPGRGGVVCNAAAGAPKAEVCDAAFVDESCDGRSNESCACVPGVSPDIPCGTDEGECQAGKQTCVGGAYGNCTVGVGPASELCDGKDNDCNGRIDDGFALGVPCAVGRGACQRTGMTVCAADGRSTVCGAAAGASAVETCNGLDDDCNGAIDDLLGTCGTTVGTCRAGTRACQSGREICQGGVAPQPDLCDGKDNDCNGVADDLFAPLLGQACSAGVGACRRDGVTICAANGVGVVCSVRAAAPGTETGNCNGIDDDCDGLIDLSVENGVLTSPCRCDPERQRPGTGRPDRGSVGLCSPAMTSLFCPVDADNQLAMSFCVMDCADPFPWAQCVLDTGSLNSFDADHQGQGILEIKFCIDDNLGRGLNFWYGNYPKRKWLPLINRGEHVTGCQRRVFTPSDAKCPVYPSTAEPPPGSIPDECRAVGCATSGGRWGAGSSTCVFDYDAVPMWVTSEGCNTGTAGGNVKITGFQVTHFPPSCVCAASADCHDPKRPLCQGGVCVAP